MTLNDSLINYPCAFPIKVMGVNQPDFKSAVIHICQQLDPSFNLIQIEDRNSKAN
jgi:putative lipoic acid-binding regulatory protein